MVVRFFQGHCQSHSNLIWLDMVGDVVLYHISYQIPSAESPDVPCPDSQLDFTLKSIEIPWEIPGSPP